MTVTNIYEIWDAKSAPKQPPSHTAPPNSQGDAGRALDGILRHLATAQPGTRNQTLNWAAHTAGGYIATGSLDPAHAAAQLANVATSIGLEAREITATIASGLTAGQKAPRYPREAVPVPPMPVFDPDAGGRDTFWGERDHLDHLRAFARARRASPWAVLGVALVRITCATPFEMVLPPLVGGIASLNLFLGLVGPSGAGKGAAEAAARDALETPDTFDTISVGSGEGLAHVYKRREQGTARWNSEYHAALINVPEIDTLAAIGSRQGSTIYSELRKAWVGEALGFAYADPSKRLPIEAHQYRMGLVAGIQPQRAQGILDDTDGGTPQRFLWMPATDPQAPDTAPVEPQPWPWSPELLPALEGRYRTPSNTRRLAVCEQAAAQVDAARLARLRGDGEALDGHALLARLKVAAALAILDTHALRDGITDDDWRLAGLVLSVSDGTRNNVTQSIAAAKLAANTARGEAEANRAVMVSEKVEEAAVKRVGRSVLRIVRSAGEEGMPHAELRRAMTSRDRSFADSAIAALITAGALLVTDDGHSKVYRTPQEES